MMPSTDATISSRAAVFRGASDVAYEDLCVPYPARGQVRVRLEGCGVCASNLPVWEGRPWFQYPLAAGAPGHEGWGVIDAVGSDVPVRVGDRVALLSGNAYASHEVVRAEDVVRLPPTPVMKWFGPRTSSGCHVRWTASPFPVNPLPA
jgi:NADPH:quinone reductase